MSVYFFLPGKSVPELIVSGAGLCRPVVALVRPEFLKHMCPSQIGSSQNIEVEENSILAGFIISQIGSCPQVGVKIKNLQHLEISLWRPPPAPNFPFCRL